MIKKVVQAIELSQMDIEEYAQVYVANLDEVIRAIDRLKVEDPREGLRVAEEVWVRLERVREEYERHRGRVVEVYVDEDLKNSDIRLEWKTSGQVFGKVLGRKKAYSFRLELPPIVVVGRDGEREVFTERPSFEIFIDFIDVFIRKENRHIRKFWNREGVIAVYIRVDRDGRRERYKIGEIKIRWISHRKIDKIARRRARRIAERIRGIESRIDEIKRLMKQGLPVNRKLIPWLLAAKRKLEEALQRELEKTRKHYACALMIDGKIGDIPVRRLLLKPRERTRKRVDAVAWAFTQRREVVTGNWSMRVMTIEEARRMLETMRFKHVCVVNERYDFYGLRGKMGHGLRILAIPGREVELYAMVQVRTGAWRRMVTLRRMPVKVSEHINGNEKMWVIEPMKSASRFVIVNSDHAHEGLDRVMVQLEKGECLVFTHKL